MRYFRSSAADPFRAGKWIRPPVKARNSFTLFAKEIHLSTPATSLRLRVTASHHYELWIDGAYQLRGPVHGDPLWCQYDEIQFKPPTAQRTFQIVFLLHHSEGIYLHYLVPSPAGLRAEIETVEGLIGTGEDWKCLPLQMWNQDVPKRG